MDVSVLCGVHSSDNGYVQKTQFTPSTDNSKDDQIDCITKRFKYYTVRWSKYLGLYARNNGHGPVPDMHFGHVDIVVGPHQLRNNKSCGLDIIGSQLSQGNNFKHKDCALSAILTITYRANHKESFGPHMFF